MWRGPDEQRRRVGQLWRTESGFAFAYERELPADFHRLAEFPEPRHADAPYTSRYLFSTFADRIPSPRRPDFEQLLASWGVTSADDQLEVLARSGGLLVTDWIELSEWRAEDDQLETPLAVRVAGARHHETGVSLAKEGDEVSLRREPANPRDPAATEIMLTMHDQRLGYVPRPYTELVAGLLDAGAQLRARVVRRLGLSETYDRWVVQIERLA
jgi:hypothetical protein